jgi:hypothetical protein
MAARTQRATPGAREQFRTSTISRQLIAGSAGGVRLLSLGAHSGGWCREELDLPGNQPSRRCQASCDRPFRWLAGRALPTADSMQVANWHSFPTTEAAPQQISDALNQVRVGGAENRPRAVGILAFRDGEIEQPCLPGRPSIGAVSRR